MLGISPELLRVTINKGHIPKDKTLMMIAGKLNLDKSVLILSAHQEKVPDEVKGSFFLLLKPKSSGANADTRCPKSRSIIWKKY